ncbi:MAG: nitrilase-related carbon-nitrogen hydrolase, partial [Thermoanaerobaculia bacterium]
MSASENVTLAAVQCALGGTVEENVAKVEALVREAARRGATVILPPELFEGPYFCTKESDE